MVPENVERWKSMKSFTETFCSGLKENGYTLSGSTYWIYWFKLSNGLLVRLDGIGSREGANVLTNNQKRFVAHSLGVGA